jgi:SAM-dependent methyltransferase
MPRARVSPADAPESAADGGRFYRTFSEKQLTGAGASRRSKIERARLALLMQHAGRVGRMLEIGPGQGTLADLAIAAGWSYSAIEPSPLLADQLRRRGIEVVQSWTPPITAPDSSVDALYADQVVEHMSGIDAARALTAEALRVLRPGGIFFVVVPDYLKERGFFYDIDYTHNFITTERRVRQLFYDGGFEIDRVVRSIGNARGVARDALAGVAVLLNVPGVDALSRYTRTEDLLFKVRKNLFETLTFVARKPGA